MLNHTVKTPKMYNYVYSILNMLFKNHDFYVICNINTLEACLLFTKKTCNFILCVWDIENLV